MAAMFVVGEGAGLRGGDTSVDVAERPKTTRDTKRRPDRMAADKTLGRRRALNMAAAAAAGVARFPAATARCRRDASSSSSSS